MKRSYRIYGATLITDFPFANRLPHGSGAPEVSFTLVQRPPLHTDAVQRETVLALPDIDDMTTANFIHRVGDCDIIEFAGTAEFYVWPKRIECRLLDPGQYYAVEILLLGTIMAWWLQRAGRVVLHASAVASHGSAFAFLATQGAGKSSLAAALSGSGCTLLADDLLALEPRGDSVLAHPGYPQMRLWPDQANWFLGCAQDLERVHPWYDKLRVDVGEGGIGGFCEEARSLGCIYIPQRAMPRTGDDVVRFEPLEPQEAFIQLLAGSFSPRHADTSNRDGSRLAAIATISRTVPVRRVIFPGGMDLLARVADAILTNFLQAQT